MKHNDLKDRTKQFTLAVIRLLSNNSKDFVTEILFKQLIRSSTSVAANYRAACRAKSKNDFIYKMSIVLEESDESMFWLELIESIGIYPFDKTQPLISESNQLTAIFVTILRSAKAT